MREIKTLDGMPRVNDLGVSYSEYGKNLDKQLKLAYKKLYGVNYNLKMEKDDKKQRLV